MKQIDAARKRYDRLRAEHDAHAGRLTEVLAGVRRKIPRQTPLRLFKSTVPAPPQDPVDGDKFPF